MTTRRTRCAGTLARYRTQDGLGQGGFSGREAGEVPEGDGDG